MANIQYYHPSKNGNGFACSFSQGKDGTIYATLLKQSTWDAQNQIGTFKESRNDSNKNVNIKLGQIEVGAILDCLDRNRGFSAPHDSEKQIKSIQFIPWFSKPIEENEKPIQRGFSFSITVTEKNTENSKNSYFIGLNLAEGRLLREFLIFALQQSFKNEVVLPEKDLPIPSSTSVEKDIF